MLTVTYTGTCNYCEEAIFGPLEYQFRSTDFPMILPPGVHKVGGDMVCPDCLRAAQARLETYGREKRAERRKQENL